MYKHEQKIDDVDFIAALLKSTGKRIEELVDMEVLNEVELDVILQFIKTVNSIYNVTCGIYKSHKTKRSYHEKTKTNEKY